MFITVSVILCSATTKCAEYALSGLDADEDWYNHRSLIRLLEQER